MQPALPERGSGLTQQQESAERLDPASPFLPADLPVLRRLLFEAGYCELKDATDARFHAFRWEGALGAPAFGHPLGG